VDVRTLVVYDYVQPKEQGELPAADGPAGRTPYA
jgi:hypothetical protein